MSFKYRSFLCALILVAWLFGCGTSNVKAMKRSHGQADSSSEANGAVLQGFPVQDLLPEVLRGVFAAIKNKALIGQVCKRWHELSNFKQNWHMFCEKHSTVLSLSKYDYQRLYYRLLKKDDVSGMRNLIITDCAKKDNFKALSIALNKPPIDSAQSDGMYAVLAEHGVSNFANITYLVPTTATIELNEIVLSSDMQALDTFITAGKNTAVDTGVDSSVRAGIDSKRTIARYGTFAVIEKLVEHWKSIPGGVVDWVAGEVMSEQNGIPVRLDVAEYLLLNGASIDFINSYSDVLEEAMKRSDYTLLELLCKHGHALTHKEELYLVLDDCGRLASSSSEEPGIDVTPLIYAVYQQDPRLVKPLLKYGGADPFQVDTQSPWLGDVLDLAKRLGNQEIVDAIMFARKVETNIKARLMLASAQDQESN